MNYSLSIKKLFREVARQKSYSRLHPALRIVMLILMLPFIVVAGSAAVVYHVLLFFRNGSQIAADELEMWLNKRKEGTHCAPESVLYFVTIPFIFFLRVLLTYFSGFLYFTWFTIMCSTYIASIGGIRWQPYLNTVSYDAEYAWSFKHSNKTFNVFALLNVVFIALCVLQSQINSYGLRPWLLCITLFMIYVAFPIVFAKKNVCAMETPDVIYTEATAYAEVNSLVNYSSAVALLEKIPDYENASELLAEYQAKTDSKCATKSQNRKNPYDYSSGTYCRYSNCSACSVACDALCR